MTLYDVEIFLKSGNTIRKKFKKCDWKLNNNQVTELNTDSSDVCLNYIDLTQIEAIITHEEIEV